MKYNKRANLSLSINSIVVLILAVTMLGLGLGFMRNTFGGATESFDQVTEEMKKEMADRMKGIDSSVDLDVYELDVAKGKTRTAYLGIKNEVSDVKTYIILNSTSCMGASSNIKLNVRSSISVPGMDVGIVPITIEGVAQDKYRITFTVTQGTNTHGAVSLYVNVV
jgi:hypothetical protein